MNEYAPICAAIRRDMIRAHRRDLVETLAIWVGSTALLALAYFWLS